MANFETSTVQTPIIISINGNIGSGKSTYLDFIKTALHGRDDIMFLQEPVGEWEKLQDEEGNNLIEKYYKNQSKYAFAFQVNAFMTRYKLIKEAMQKNVKYIITERCLFTDKHIFAKMLYHSKTMEKVEYEIYNSMFEEYNTIMKNPVFIYIRTDPEICKSRIEKRNRKGESSVDIEYLKLCHKYHEQWLLNKHVLHKMVVNGDPNIDFHTSTPKEDMKKTEWMKSLDSFLDFYNDGYVITSRNVVYT